MKEKPKKVLLSLGMIATVVSPVATVIACSKTVEDLTQDDLSGLVDETALASDITEEEVVAFLSEMGVEVTPEEIDLESDDAAGTLTVTITYTNENDEQQTNVIELTGFKVDAGEEETNPDEAVAEDSTSVADLTPGEFSDFVNASKLPSAVIPNDIVDYLKGIGVEVTTDDVAVKGDDATGTLTVTITYTNDDGVAQEKVIKLTGFKAEAGDEEDTVAVDALQDGLDKLGASVEFGIGTNVDDDDATKNEAIALIKDSDAYKNLTDEEKTAVDAFLTAANASVDTTNEIITFTKDSYSYEVSYTVAVDALQDGLDKLGASVEFGIGTNVDDDDATKNEAIALIKDSDAYKNLTDEEKTAVDAFLTAANASVDTTNEIITFTKDSYSYEVSYTVAVDALQDGLDKLGASVEFGIGTNVDDDDATKNEAIALIKDSDAYKNLTDEEKTAVDAFLTAANASVDTTNEIITFTKDSYSYEVSYTVAVDALQDGLDKLGASVEFGIGTNVDDDDATKNEAIALIKDSDAYKNLTDEEKTAVDAFLTAANASVDTTNEIITFTKDSYSYEVSYTVAVDALQDGLDKLGASVEFGIGTNVDDDDATKNEAIALIKDSDAYKNLTDEEKTAVDAFLTAANASVDTTNEIITFTKDSYSYEVSYTVAVAPGPNPK